MASIEFLLRTPPLLLLLPSQHPMQAGNVDVGCDKARFGGVNTMVPLCNIVPLPRTVEEA